MTGNNKKKQTNYSFEIRFFAKRQNFSNKDRRIAKQKQTMVKNMSKIEHDIQDRNSVAWKKLCDYVEKVAAENSDEFSP
ncbi:MAG: hypothetical protein IPI65_10950 [Bacteroidetes bacterium]|nr:hypothetical protein [Bacteroidota bacterium]